MNDKKVCVEKLSSGEIYFLDIDTGFFEKINSDENIKIQGQLYVLDDKNTFFVYGIEKKLFLQWNESRWDLLSDSYKIRYRHIFDKQKTVFSIDDKSIEYDAWWKDDHFYNKCAPEIDEWEDYMAYLFQMSKDVDLKTALLKRYTEI